MAKTLHIVDGAYRANIEEQDDPSLWFAAALQGAGANLSLLLQGKAGPLCGQLLAETGARVIKVESTGRPDGARRGSARFFDLLNGEKRSVALDLASAAGRRDLGRLIAKGVAVYVVADDVAERGLEGTELIEGIRPLARNKVPALVIEHKRVWRL